MLRIFATSLSALSCAIVLLYGSPQALASQAVPASERQAPPGAPRYAPGISEGSYAYFQGRCKLAGVKVYQQPTKERGIEVLRPRKKVDSMDQWSWDDPFGDGSREDSYIYSFIVWRDAEGRPTSTNPEKPGFNYVDVSSPTGRLRYVPRYEPLVSKWAEPGELRFQATVKPAPASRAKYGVTFEDISTIEDRQRWVAGGTIKLIELSTGVVVAERTGFMMDPQNGRGVEYGRQPWGFALRLACPAFPVSAVTHLPVHFGITRDFLEPLLLSK